MPQGRVEVRVRHLRPMAVIDLGGDIASQAAHDLAAAYEEALSCDPASVLLNFTDVEYIDSKGIALLVGILARARREERTLSACGLTAHYLEIFEITRLTDFMQVFPNEPAATCPSSAGRA